MSLFRRCNEPIKFVFVSVDENELEELRTIIVANGGDVSCDDPHMQIKFTQVQNYSDDICPGAKVYSVDFIRQCVDESKIVNPEPYRLSPKFIYDECLMSHFLFGHCECLSTLSSSTCGPTTKFTPLTETPEMTSDFSATAGDTGDQPKLSNDLVSTIDDGEKCSCSLEYQMLVEPKLQMLERQRTKHQRTPTTLSTETEVPRVALSEASSGNLDGDTKLSEPVELMNVESVDGNKDSNDEKKSATSLPSEASTTIVNYPRERAAAAQNRLSSDTMVTLPESSCIAAQDIPGDDSAIAKCARSESWERLEENSESRPSPTKQLRASLKNSQNDTATNCSKSNNSANEVNLNPLKVLNVFHKSSSHALIVPLKRKSGTRSPLESETDVSSDEILISRARFQNDATSSSENGPTTVNGNSTSHRDDEDWTKAGPSRSAGPRRTLTQADILSGASSSDEKFAALVADVSSDDLKLSQQRSQQNSFFIAQIDERVQTINKAIVEACINLNEKKLPCKKRVSTSVERETSTDSEESKTRQKSYRPKRKRRHLSEIIPTPKADRSRESTSKKGWNKSVEIVAHRDKRTSVDPADVIVLSSTDDDDRISTSNWRNGKTSNDRENRGVKTINTKREPNVDRSARNKGNHFATVPEKSAKTRATERLRTSMTCKTIGDLARYARLGGKYVKIAGNIDPDMRQKLIDEAHLMKLLVQDSETEDENDTRTTSVRNKNCNATTVKSQKGHDKRKAKSTRPVALTLSSESETNNNDKSVGGKKTKKNLNESSKGNRDASSISSRITDTSSVDSDSSLRSSFAAVMHSTLRATPETKSVEKKARNNRSTNPQQDEADSSSSIDRSTNHRSIRDSHVPYSDTETNLIIKYLVKTNSIAQAKGRKIFEEMSKYKKLNHRSATSLYNRFQKILPCIDQFTAALKLQPAIREDFKKLKKRER